MYDRNTHVWDINRKVTGFEVQEAAAEISERSSALLCYQRTPDTA